MALIASPVLPGLDVLGGVVATSVGGLFSVWLRTMTESVYVPMAAHWMLDPAGEAVAFLVFA